MSLGPRFVDRRKELEELLRLAEEGFYPVLYLYGPEGCGKTRLLKELYAKLRERDEFAVFYIDAQSTESIEKAVYAPPEALKLVLELAKEITGPPGRIAALAILRVLSILKKSLLRGRHVVVLIDDVARPLGLDTVEMYAKNMLNLVEELLASGARSVFMLATTSEGISRSLLARHNYVSLAQMWNLDKGSFYELLNILGAPNTILDEAWLALGGNPRMALALHYRRWNLIELENSVYRSIAALLEPIAKKFYKELLTIVEDIDRIIEYPHLKQHLLETNLITPIDRPCLGYTPSPDPELGIGKQYAWQIPMYRKLVARYLENIP